MRQVSSPAIQASGKLRQAVEQPEGAANTAAYRLKRLAPRARLELATLRLTAECSTIELPGSRGNQKDTSRRLKPSQSSQGSNECQCGEMRVEAKELEAVEEKKEVNQAKDAGRREYAQILFP